MLKQTLIAIGLLLASSTTAMAQTQASYPLICRGGPSMRIVTAHDVPDGVRTGQNSMTVFFRASASPANPGPGECVWMDRTFRPGEPQNFWLKGPVEFAFQVTGDGRVVRDASGWRLNPEGRSAQARSWARIVNAILNGQTFTVNVYNSDNRTMVVTGVN